MRVLLLEGDMSRAGGTERMTAWLSEKLAANHTVHIVSLNMLKDRTFFTLSQEVTHTVLPAGNMLSKIYNIRRYIQKEHMDVVINVDTGMGIYGILASKGTKAKVVTWEHANFCNNWNSRIFPYLRRFAAKHSDKMVVLTEKDKQNYVNGIPKCVPITAIPNPVGTHDYKYDAGSKTILSAGLLAEIKRFDLIPEIGREIFRTFPDWQWIICGEGSLRGPIQEKIDAYGLGGQIILKGRVADMDSVYQSAAMYVMTSRMEGLPMVLLEAKSYGLPLVSFDIMTGPSDIIRHEVNGYLVTDGRIDEMAQCMMQLMNDTELRKRFSDHAVLDMDKFREEKVINKWENLLRSL